MENVSTPVESSAPASQAPRRINPDGWTSSLGYSQAIEVRGDQKVLYCAGQTALDSNGELPAALDIRSQMTAALDNLERLLSVSGYRLADVVRLNIYTCAMEETLQNLDVFVSRVQENDSQPAASLLGVTSLAYPELLVEIEATAVR